MKSTRTPRARIPKSEVLDWLFKNHPALHVDAEVDRDWVWLAADLRSDPATRQAIKEYGFVFARKGGHPLPSGKLGTWGHSCTRPLPFYKGKRKHKRATTATATAETEDAELSDVLGDLAEISA